MSKSLRPERARSFASKFVKNGFNSTQAVVDCGITENRNSAHVIGYRLLQNATTIKAVEEHIKKAKMSADEVIEELSSVAKSETPISEQSKMKALEMLAKAHNLVDKRAEQPRESSRDNDILRAKQSYIIAALPDIQLIHPDWPVLDLQNEAERRFSAWYQSLNIDPLASNWEQ